MKAEAMDRFADLTHQKEQDPYWYHGAVKLTIRQFESINVLCQDLYWSRMWIVQEVTLAARAVIHCGSRAVDFSLFEDLVYTHHSITTSGHSFFGPALEVCYYRSFRTIYELDGAIMISKKRMATDIRDRVYALFGLVKELSDIPVDYNITREALWEVMFSKWCQTADPSVGRDYVAQVGYTVAEALEIEKPKEKEQSLLETLYLPRRATRRRIGFSRQTDDAEFLRQFQSDDQAWRSETWTSKEAKSGCPPKSNAK